MCGIAGFVDYSLSLGRDDLVAMTDQLESRGPDDQGQELEPNSQFVVGLGHRRLSILDLSPRGHQPMTSASGRLTITYNGEVYNFRDLRARLEGEGQSFKGDSDTEVILEAIDAWGMDRAVASFVGMFAFACWDRETRKLHLVRDRLGIKPLYYGWVGKTFTFASQLKAITTLSQFDGELNRDALARYFQFCCIPGAHSIYQGLHKLEPGERLELDAGSLKSGGLPQPRREKYWDVADVWRSADRLTSFEEGTEHLKELVREAVRSRMVADVPLGAFLSGGIDSSLVVALMQEESTRPVKTFSIGFNEASFNEAPFAKEVAQRLGTDHTELYVSPADLLRIVPDIPSYWDEPFADSSQIPTFVLSRLTREHVTVALTGDGGDEILAGYTRYPQALDWLGDGILGRGRRFMARSMLPVMDLLWRCTNKVTAHKIQLRLAAMTSTDLRVVYEYLSSNFRNPEDIVSNGISVTSHIMAEENSLVDLEPLGRMQVWDLMGYLPDDILTKVDRATMAVSLEARVPLLDHRVVEFAARFGSELTMKRNEGKQPLRHMLKTYIPDRLISRPKQGFGIPVIYWLRTDLRDWAEDLLSERALQEHGYLNAKLVRAMWVSCLRGEAHWGRQLWPVLMFQAWLRARP